MSYIDVTSHHLVTTAQEYLLSTMKKLPLYNILIHNHLVVAVTLALAFLKYSDNAMMTMKPKIKKHC